MPTLNSLLADARACTLCAKHLPLGPRPIVQLHAASRILIAGQAPGRKVHESGVPFDDASGDRLRSWLGISRDTFYDARSIAILPMGFCYPGTGSSGDLPPRAECAPARRAPLLAKLTQLRLTLVVGQYALAYHLPAASVSLTDTVFAWRDHWPDVVPLPHPSPRNNIWLKKNPWFELELLPVLQDRVAQVLGADHGCSTRNDVTPVAPYRTNQPVPPRPVAARDTPTAQDTPLRSGPPRDRQPGRR